MNLVCSEDETSVAGVLGTKRRLGRGGFGEKSGGQGTQDFGEDWILY